MSSVMDERCDPPLRAVIGDLLTRCDRADIAVAEIRLAALDLGAGELGGVTRCRILLGRLDARTLEGRASTDTAALRHSRALLQFLESDRVEIRNSGLSSWVPDFSIFHVSGKRSCLVGAHYFRDPVAARGPSLTCTLDDVHAADLLAGRFEELWDAGHDVGDAVRAAVRLWIAQQDARAPEHTGAS